ncbi:MAG TPA: tetratricopeptide repeat protein [Acidobacteriota bacterium]|nr:tetratricopeptide repeat protein [Acidobacteriota bacterium]
MKSCKSWGVLSLLALAAAFPPSAPSQTVEAMKVLDQCSPGAVSILFLGENKQEIARGTAFALSEDVVVTSYHLVSRAIDAEATNAKGKKLKVEGVVAVSKPCDIALLKLKGKLQPLAAAAGEAPAIGTRIFAVGANETGQIVVSEGTIRGFLELEPGRRCMDVSLAVPASFSGSPVVGLDGRVVGIVLVLDRLKSVVPANAFTGLAGSTKVTLLKDMAREDYFAGLEGAFLAGRLAAMMDETAAARMYLEKAVSLDPSLVEAHALLASIYSGQRDLAAAVGAYGKVIALDPGRVSAHHRLGSLYIRMQRFGDAVTALQKAVSLDPGRADAFLDLGTAYEESKDYARAAEAYEKYVALKPENPWTGYLRLGLCRLELNQPEAAVAALSEALKLQPNDVKTNFSLADAYTRAKILDKAEAIYETLVGLNPEGATTYYGKIIQIYDEAGQYDKAIEAARKIIEMNPKNELAVFNLGIMFLKLQRTDEAVRAFRDALAIKPDYVSAQYNIGYSYSLAKRWKESVEGFQKYTELAPDDPLGYLNVGVGLMMLKSFEAALEPLRKFIELKPDNAVAHYNLAIVYLNLKDNFSAREVYKTLLDLNPEYAERLKKLLR